MSNLCQGGCGRSVLYGSMCHLCARHAQTPPLGNPVLDDDGGPVTRETVGADHFQNDITANAAVHARMSKAQYIRWLLDDRKRLEGRVVELTRMQPAPTIILKD